MQENMLAISENIGNLSRDNEEPFWYARTENTISEVLKKITDWA